MDVESNVEPRLRRRSGVVADSPLGPLVHLFQISGPVRSFFSHSCLFSGSSAACRGAVGGSGCVGRLGGAGLGCPGAAKPTVGVTVGVAGAAVSAYGDSPRRGHDTHRHTRSC